MINKNKHLDQKLKQKLVSICRDRVSVIERVFLDEGEKEEPPSFMTEAVTQAIKNNNYEYLLYYFDILKVSVFSISRIALQTSS